MASAPRLTQRPGTEGASTPSHEAMPELTSPTQAIPFDAAKPVADPIFLSPDIQGPRRGLDPFILGVMVGAMAVLVGMLLGFLILTYDFGFPMN